MRFFDWRKGVVARLTHPYRYHNIRAKRSVFVPKGTSFITEHARRGQPEGFQIPVTLLDHDNDETNMSKSVAGLYPDANFMFVSDHDTPIRAEIESLDRVATEWFAVSDLSEVEGSIPYLSEGKAVNYLGRLVVADKDAILMKRSRDTLEEIHGGCV
jgi:hypothetical protein